MHIFLPLAAPDRPSASVFAAQLESSHPLAGGLPGTTQLNVAPGGSLSPRGLHLGHRQHSHILCPAGHSVPLGSATDAVGQPVPHFSQNLPSVGNTCQAPTRSHGSPWKPPAWAEEATVSPLEMVSSTFLTIIPSQILSIPNVLHYFIFLKHVRAFES